MTKSGSNMEKLPEWSPCLYSSRSQVCQENGSKASLPCLLPFSEVLTWISAVLSLPAVLKVEHTGLHLGWLPSFWWRFPWFWPELQSGQHTGIANVKTKAILPTFLCPFQPPSQSMQRCQWGSHHEHKEEESYWRTPQSPNIFTYAKHFLLRIKNWNQIQWHPAFPATHAPI